MPKLHPFKWKSSFGSLQQNLKRLSMQNVNTIGNHLNRTLQENIEAGKSVDGSAFEPLKPSSREARTNRTLYYSKYSGGGNKPLIWSKNLRQTKKTPATLNKLRFIIAMNSKRGVQYGAFHNEGYITSPKCAVPNKRVPKRKWFGIPKEFQKGGKELKLAMDNIGRNIGHFFGGTSKIKIKL